MGRYTVVYVIKHKGKTVGADIKSKLAKLGLKEVSGYLTNRQLVELKQRIITLIEA